MNRIPTFRWYSDQSILLEWPAKIDESIHQEIMDWKHLLEEVYRDEIIELVITYNAILIFIKPEVDPSEFLKKLHRVEVKSGVIPKKPHRLIEVPVCYDTEFGIDLEHVAKVNQLKISEVIQLHTQPIYKAYFIGFLPGFPYLGGLDPRLATKRKVAPRKIIEQGAVGIGGAQTGIYPGNYPGGWNIIGRTPLSLFDVRMKQPSLIMAGDTIRFVAISKAEFELISIEIKAGTYTIENEMIYD